jgi:hypothetical protein
MTAADELIRETLHERATAMPVSAPAASHIAARARSYRARRTAVAVVGSFAVLVVGGGVPAALGAFDREPQIQIGPGVYAPAQSYETWAPRGRLGSDAAFVALATQAWDASGYGPREVINVLWAGGLRTGRAAVLLGETASGERRLAVLAGSGELRVIRDQPAPRSLEHLSFNLFTDGPDGEPYVDDLLVLTPPQSGWVIAWSGGDDPALGAGTVRTDDGVAIIPIDQSGPLGHPTIRILDGSRVVYDGPIGTYS